MLFIVLYILSEYTAALCFFEFGHCEHHPTDKSAAMMYYLFVGTGACKVEVVIGDLLQIGFDAATNATTWLYCCKAKAMHVFVRLVVL